MTLKDIYQNLGQEAEYKKEIKKSNNRLYMMAGELDNLLLQKSASDVRIRAFELMGELQMRNLQAAVISNSVLEEDLAKNLYFFSHVLQAHKEHRWPSRSGYMVVHDNRPDYFLDSKLKEILNELPLLDIGYRYSDKQIIKTGAQELDESLVIENLEWLKNYPTARKSFASAMKYYLSGDFPDAITNAYSSLEGLTKTVLDTNKRLDSKKTREALLRKLDLGAHWSQILVHFSQIAHEFSSRHGDKENKKKEKDSEDLKEHTEFFIYVTGAVIRLISRKIPKPDND